MPPGLVLSCEGGMRPISQPGGSKAAGSRLGPIVLYPCSLLWDPDEVSVLATSGLAAWGFGDSRQNGGLVGVGSDVPCINPPCKG